MLYVESCEVRYTNKHGHFKLLRGPYAVRRNRSLDRIFTSGRRFKARLFYRIMEDFDPNLVPTANKHWVKRMRKRFFTPMFSFQTQRVDW